MMNTSKLGISTLACMILYGCAEVAPPIAADIATIATGVEVNPTDAEVISNMHKIDRRSVRNVDPKTSIGEGQSIVSGSVRFIANGKPVEYTAFKRPIFRLLRREDAMYYVTPETDYSGNFLWSLPYGSYDVEILDNMVGYMPMGVYVLNTPIATYYKTNGFVRPGLKFSVAPGDIRYLGTLIVDVTVSDENFLGDTKFKSLNGMRIANNAMQDPNWQIVRHRPNSYIRLFDGDAR